MALGKRNQKSNMSSHFQINGPKKTCLNQFIYTHKLTRVHYSAVEKKKGFDVLYSFYYYIRPPVPDENVARQTIAIVLLRHRNNRMESASAF